jgi:hypothetical protein
MPANYIYHVFLTQYNLDAPKYPFREVILTNVNGRIRLPRVDRNIRDLLEIDLNTIEDEATRDEVECQQISQRFINSIGDLDAIKIPGRSGRFRSGTYRATFQMYLLPKDTYENHTRCNQHRYIDYWGKNDKCFALTTAEVFRENDFCNIPFNPMIRDILFVKTAHGYADSNRDSLLPRVAYHGTDKRLLYCIIGGGLRPSVDEDKIMLGPGFYFGNFFKAVRFSFNNSIWAGEEIDRIPVILRYILFSHPEISITLPEHNLVENTTDIMNNKDGFPELLEQYGRYYDGKPNVLSLLTEERVTKEALDETFEDVDNDKYGDYEMVLLEPFSYIIPDNYSMRYTVHPEIRINNPEIMLLSSFHDIECSTKFIHHVAIDTNHQLKPFTTPDIIETEECSELRLIPYTPNEITRYRYNSMNPTGNKFR